MNFEIKMATSVIISTYNGAKKLPEIFASLENQSFKNFELLIVVDGSTDATATLLKEWEGKFQNFKAIYQPNLGRAAVRNTGVRNAEGDLLVFFDDDLIVDQHCLKDHIEYQHKTNFENVFVGEIIDKPIETADNEEFIKYKKYVATGWHYLMYRKDRKIDEHLFDGDYYMAGANFSITKEIFNKVGGLDESLERAEDYEFAIRAKLAGIKIILGDRYATVIHRDNNNNFRDWLLKARLGQINNHKVYTKDKVKFKAYAPPEKTVKNFIKRIIFKSLANQYAYNFMISNSRIKKKIPVSLLYKTYDLIVAANSKYFPDNVKV